MLNFWPLGGQTTILIKGVSKSTYKMVKNKKISTRVFFLKLCCNLMLKFHPATIKIQREYRFLVFFLKKLFGVAFRIKLNINGPRNLENICTNLYDGLK